MIFSTDRLHAEAKDVVSRFGLVEEKADDRTLAECEVLLARPSRVTRKLLAKMPRLRAIQTISAGVDEVNFASIPADVRVYSNAGAFTVPVAEHAWGLLLAAAKGAATSDRKMEGYQLRGRTMLVLGCGAIGSEVARIAKAGFRMTTVGLSRSFSDPKAFDLRRAMGELEASIAEADAVIDALPLNLETKSLLSYAVLSKMKRRVVLVNVGRAETVNEASIARLLKERPETRFATDVFWRKSGVERFDSDLWKLSNFWGTRHMAGGIGSEEVLGYAQKKAAENIRLFLTSGEASNRVEVRDYRRVGRRDSVT